MVFYVTKLPITRFSFIRGLSKAASIPVGGCKDYNVNVSTLQNKLIVATAENNSAIARVSVTFKAGSRYETCENLGASHVIRIAAGLSTENSSQFAITRNLQQIGASLTCATDRETITYTLDSTQEALETALPFLADVVSKQCFRPWEVADNSARLKLDLKLRTPQIRVIDILHKAAFRKQGLGNSLFIQKKQIGKISSETLQHYVSNNLTANRGAVVGLGVESSTLVDFAESLDLGCSTRKDECTNYIGGEIRYERTGDTAVVAIVGEGASLSNLQEALAFAVLQHALGGTAPVKYAKPNQGSFSKTLDVCSQNSQVTPLNINYSDTGLFGALITATSSEVNYVTQAVFSALKEGKVSDEDVNRGKKQLKASLLLALECGNNAINDIGAQAILTGSVCNTDELVSAIDKITTTDINTAAKKVAKSKLSIASYGNLHNVPYLDEFK